MGVSHVVSLSYLKLKYSIRKLKRDPISYGEVVTLTYHASKCRVKVLKT